MVRPYQNLLWFDRTTTFRSRKGPPMKYVALQVTGMIALVLGAQGAIRLLADHDDAGLLSWVAGGFATQLACYTTLTLCGALVAARGASRTKNPE